MGDKLRESISRLSTFTDLNLVEIYDRRKTVKDEPDPNEQRRKEVQEQRAKLPNRTTKRTYDREVRKKESPKYKEAKRNRKNDLRRLKKLQAKLDKEYPDGARPTLIPSHLYKTVKHVVADTTGAASDLYSSMCPHKIAITTLKRIALAIDENGEPKYSFSGIDQGAIRARYIMALGLLLIGLSKRTGRRSDRWNRIVKGLSQSRLIDTISHPGKDAKPVSYSAFNGTHDKEQRKTAIDGSVGYLRALKNGKFLYTRQCHWKEGSKPTARGWDDMQPNEVAPVLIDGQYRVSYCRYWLLTDNYTSPKDAAVRAQLWADWLGGYNAQLPETNRTRIQERRGELKSLSSMVSPAPT